MANPIFFFSKREKRKPHADFQHVLPQAFDSRASVPCFSSSQCCAVLHMLGLSACFSVSHSLIFESNWIAVFPSLYPYFHTIMTSGFKWMQRCFLGFSPHFIFWSLLMSYYLRRKWNFNPGNPQMFRIYESKGCEKGGGRGKLSISFPHS